MNLKKILPFLVATTIIFLLTWFQILSTKQSITLWITSVTAIFWITEWLPIPIASLIPIALFPLLSIISPNEVALAYGNPLIILLMGGFLLSSAMTHSKTHHYLANSVLSLIGTDSPRKILLGFMLTAF